MPIGLAMSGPRCPAPSRGSARRARTGRARPALAERRGRQQAKDPASTAASSDRMSPNRFSVTITSKSAGRADEQHRARIDELVVEGDVGVVGRDLVGDLPPQARRREHVGLVDRASPAAAASGRARTRAARSARSRLGVGQRVERASERPARADASRRARRSRCPPVSSRTMTRSTPVEQLGPERRRRRRARAGRVTGRRFAYSPSPPRSANSACSGRTVALGSSHFGPPTAPRSMASAAPQAATSSSRIGDAVRVDRGAADERARTSRRRSRTRPPAASTTRRAAATTSGPTPSPGIVAIR